MDSSPFVPFGQYKPKLLDKRYLSVVDKLASKFTQSNVCVLTCGKVIGTGVGICEPANSSLPWECFPGAGLHHSRVAMDDAIGYIEDETSPLPRFKNVMLFSTSIPCIDCLKQCIEFGVTRIVVKRPINILNYPSPEFCKLLEENHISFELY